MTVETLVDVAGWKAGAHWAFVDILHALLSGRHDDRPFYEEGLDVQKGSFLQISVLVKITVK